MLQGRERPPWSERGQERDWLLRWARDGRIRWACQGCIDAGRAILADPNRQVRFDDVYCPVYRDLSLTCADCGADFVNTAEEQRVWYEEYRMRMTAGPGIPRLCRSCRYDKRQRRRAMHALQARLRDYDPLRVDDLLEIAALYEAVGAADKAALFRRRAKNRAD
jgi:hypothetical protein